MHRTELVQLADRVRFTACAGAAGGGLSFRIRGVSGKQHQWLQFRSARRTSPLARMRSESLIPSDALATLTGIPSSTRSNQSPSTQPKNPEPIESTIEPRVEPVVLLKGRPATRFQLLGMVEAKGPNRRRSENGLAIRAAMMGADAVVDLNAERLPGFLRTDHRSSGTAVRSRRPRGQARAQEPLVRQSDQEHPNSDADHGRAASADSPNTFEPAVTRHRPRSRFTYSWEHKPARASVVLLAYDRRLSRSA